MDFLQTSHLSKEIDGKNVLENISFSQRKHQKIAIAGETGAGKSTLLKIIAGLVQTDDGEVKLNGERIKGPEEKLVPGHPEIAYLSQHFELQKHLRVEQVLSYANKLPEGREEEIIEICQIGHLLERKTNHLSGGERQRIALARLLLTSPQLLLLDEPYSNMDVMHKNILKSVIDNISAVMDITCILISHEPADTLSWADEIIVLRAGTIIQKGSPEMLYHKPADEYVAGLLGKINLLNAAIVKEIPALSGKRANTILTRPEFIHISSKGEEGALKGKVKKVHFFGSHYELHVVVKGGEVVLNSLEAPDEGAHVYVTFDPHGLWELNHH